MGRLESLPFIHIFEETERYVVAYNQHTASGFQICFPEHFTREDLKSRIHISANIPSFLQFDIDTMAAYLWAHMDNNAFLTLNGLWFVWNAEDYREIARFHECDEAILLPEHKAKGCMWYARQVCIVDVQQIILYWQRKQPSHKKTPDFEAVTYLRRDLVVTTLHELCHLILETNPAFWEDYPEEMGTEFQVERYAQETCEYKDIIHVFKERNDFYVDH